MPAGSSSPQDDDELLQEWRQGDFALDVGGFVFAKSPTGDFPFDIEEKTDGIIGLVVISQTCDIVRRTGGRHYVTVCPLIEVPQTEAAAIRKGKRPYLTDVGNASDRAFADLRRIMSVHKDLAATWKRQEGFSSEAGRVRFAAALERKFGQFAFPDEFDQATESFRKRVWQRHNKGESPVGKVYRSLSQIRFHAEPSWDAPKRKITVIAIMKPVEDREVKKREDISEELTTALAEIVWPGGYESASPELMLQTARDLTGEDIIASRRGDFDFLCY